MNALGAHPYRRATLLAIALILFTLPFLARAQTATSSDLQTTIRAELLSDPRTSSLSSAQLDAMVSLLTDQAEAQGITAEDITWRPQTFSDTSANPAAAQESCAGNFTCTLDEAFGFIGPDSIIPFALGFASMGLIWILAEMIHRRKYPHLFT